MVLHIENRKDSTKKHLELINKFSKVARYKMSMQKSVAFLYTNNHQKEKLRKQPHSCIKNNKIPRSKVNQGGERPIH